MMKKIWEAFKSYSELVKLPHTLFALPFALSAACIAQAETGGLTIKKFLLIVLAFTFARSVAMGFNRIADCAIDRKNPRTKNRPTCTGEISIKKATAFVSFSAVAFVITAGFINELCFVLSFPALILLFGYSYCKRFTSAAHYILGCTLACAPAGAWIAVADSFDWRILTLSFGLMFNIAAFDIFYAVQDMEFDKKNGLFSVPSRFGMKGVFAFSSASMLFAFLCFCGAAYVYGNAPLFWACSVLIGLIYVAAEAIFFSKGIKKIDLIFFRMNVSISLLILLAGASLLF